MRSEKDGEKDLKLIHQRNLVPQLNKKIQLGQYPLLLVGNFMSKKGE